MSEYGPIINCTLGELVKTIQQQVTLYNTAFYAIVQQLANISKSLEKLVELAQSGFIQVAVND